MKISVMEEAKKLLLACFVFVSLLLLVSTVTAEPSWQHDQITVIHDVEKVAEVLSRCEDYNKLFKHVTHSQRISRNQCYIEAKFHGFTLWMKLQLDGPKYDADKRTIRIHGRMLDGNMKYFGAEIKLIKVGDNKTFVEMRLKSDPRLPGILDATIDEQTRKVISRALVILNKRLFLGKY